MRLSVSGPRTIGRADDGLSRFDPTVAIDADVHVGLRRAFLKVQGDGADFFLDAGFFDFFADRRAPVDPLSIQSTQLNVIVALVAAAAKVTHVDGSDSLRKLLLE